MENRLCLNIYIVDVLFNLKDDNEDRLIRPTREETALVVGAAYVGPMLVLHGWDMLQLGSIALSQAIRAVCSSQEGKNGPGGASSFATGLKTPSPQPF